MTATRDFLESTSNELNQAVIRAKEAVTDEKMLRIATRCQQVLEDAWIKHNAAHALYASKLKEPALKAEAQAIWLGEMRSYEAAMDALEEYLENLQVEPGNAQGDTAVDEDEDVDVDKYEDESLEVLRQQVGKKKKKKKKKGDDDDEALDAMLAALRAEYTGDAPLEDEAASSNPAAAQEENSKKKRKKESPPQEDDDRQDREVDYMSDESSDSEEEEEEKADAKGVDQDEGLSKMLDSEESSDENKDKDKDKEDEDKKGAAAEKVEMTKEAEARVEVKKVEMMKESEARVEVKKEKESKRKGEENLERHEEQKDGVEEKTSAEEAETLTGSPKTAVQKKDEKDSKQLQKLKEEKEKESKGGKPQAQEEKKPEAVKEARPENEDEVEGEEEKNMKKSKQENDNKVGLRLFNVKVEVMQRGDVITKVLLSAMMLCNFVRLYISEVLVLVALNVARFVIVSPMSSRTFAERFLPHLSDYG